MTPKEFVENYMNENALLAVMAGKDYLKYSKNSIILLLMEEYALLREQAAWVSVEDRLPENQQKVLCYNGFRMIENNWCLHTNQDSEWFKEQFTHWMPLPQLPKDWRKDK
jgi:hypothetical protein